jgi:hypothetical protein
MPAVRVNSWHRQQHECGGQLAAAESFFGVFMRVRINRKYYMTRSEARSDIFDYLERFHKQRKMRQLGSGNIHQPALN